MATRTNVTKDGKKNKRESKMFLREKEPEQLPSKLFEIKNASVATKSSQHQQDDGDVLLNQDIFWHMFDFLRFDALITCKLLSKDVSRRAHQRMMNDGNVLQISNSNDFCYDWTAIGNVVVPNDIKKDLAADRIEERIRWLILDLSRRLKLPRWIDGKVRLIDEKMPIKDVQFSFQDEWAFCIVLNDRILKRIKVRPAIYNACKFFTKVNQEIAATMDGFDGYCDKLTFFVENDWHYLLHFFNSSFCVENDWHYLLEKIIQNEIDVDAYLNYENGGGNHDADHAHDDANDHDRPQKKRKTSRSTR